MIQIAAMFANATTDALPPPGGIASVGWVMISLGAIFVILNQGSAFFQRQRGAPANEELKGGVDSLGLRLTNLEKDAQEAMVRRRAMHDKIERTEQNIRGEVKHDAEALHEKINRVSQDVAALSAKTEGQNRQLAHIESKLDRLIERKT